jgi:hypothetical protein
MKTEKTFNVLVININTRQLEQYDVLKTFRRVWNNKGHNFDKDKVTDFESLRNWIERVSNYHFGHKTEWEFLIADWPFGSYKFKQDMKQFLADNPQLNLDDYNTSINFNNIIMREMTKIDVNKQIMMNIDIVTEILFDEFLPDPKSV